MLCRLTASMGHPPRQELPGVMKCLQIEDFLCFLLNFTNDLPIFLESQTCFLASCLIRHFRKQDSTNAALEVDYASETSRHG